LCRYYATGENKEETPCCKFVPDATSGVVVANDWRIADVDGGKVIYEVDSSSIAMVITIDGRFRYCNW